MKYLPTTKLRGTCPRCGKPDLALLSDGRIARPHQRQDLPGQNCTGHGAFAVGQPTQPAENGQPAPK